MSDTPSKSGSSNAPAIGRGWLIAGGILSLMVGFSAMGSPYLYSLVLARFLGIFALVSGFIALPVALFGKDTRHRVLEALLAVVRIAAGVILLNCLKSSVVVITFILAIFLIVEGVLLTGASLRLRGTPGWFLMMLSGMASLILGVMVYNRWPSDSAAVLGFFLGLHLVMNGASLLALGLGGPRPADASPAAAA
jgi:uncharacterized membrane protein HdeD (DUF308 family)